jgi:hypothetical protein
MSRDMSIVARYCAKGAIVTLHDSGAVFSLFTAAKNEQIGDHASPQQGFGLSTPRGAAGGGLAPGNTGRGRQRESAQSVVHQASCTVSSGRRRAGSSPWEASQRLFGPPKAEKLYNMIMYEPYCLPSGALSSCNNFVAGTPQRLREPIEGSPGTAYRNHTHYPHTELPHSNC